MKTLTAAIALSLAATAPMAARADNVEVFNEGFDSVPNFPGWVQVNNSVPAGNGWFEGNPTVFRAQAGAGNSYIAASYLSAQFGSGTVDTWLITPVINLNGASTFSFFTRGASDPGFSDQLQVYFAGGTGTAVGGFTNLLATIGDGAYPTAWTQYSSDFDFTGAGRFAFHYVGDASTLNYIGIDSVKVISAVPEPAPALMLGLGLGAVGLLRRRSLT
ncbi:MAG: choice-of-anchor J domain-containing protein [Telluria sp.]